MGEGDATATVNVLSAVVMLVVAALLVLVVRLGASGRLGPNSWAGVRTKDTMAGPRQWRAAHQAAMGPTLVAAMGLGLAGAVVLVVHTFEMLVGVLLASAVWTVVWALIGLMRGEQAARDVGRRG